MLKAIRRLVQEINAAHNFSEALEIMVKRVREAIATEACTVFLIDQTNNDYVLMATDGLNQKAVKRIRLKLHEGLVGLVGQREEPINLDDAPSHPQFSYHAEIGEDRFKAFLGVPIIHHRRLLGVLVVQQEEQRRFDESEEAFLVTMSAQLSGVIAHAEATGVIHNLLHANQSRLAILSGVPSAPGIGIGEAVVFYSPADLDAVPDKKITDVAAEIAIFDAALAAAKEDIRILSSRLTNRLPAEELAIFDVYLRILDSASLRDEILDWIRQGEWAQGALRKVIRQHLRQFAAMEDEYLRERSVDFRDLGRRILAHLQANQATAFTYPKQTILVGEEVTASALAEVAEGHLAGVVSVKGSSNSHVAILARAMNVPAIMGVSGMDINLYDGQKLIIDGYYGHVYVSPSAELRQEFIALAKEERQLDANLQALHALPAETSDGHSISLFINAGLAADAGPSLIAGAEGVGLYRTEIPFMIRERFPAEEEQRIIYRQLLQAFAPRPVVMRMLDIGGDKALPYFPVQEDNPFLGWRGIRITLDHPEVFLVQARAMLRASAELNNLQIMFPMITTTNEVDEALRLLKQAYHEVLEEGSKICMPPVGVMIEVPSAVYQAKSLAQRVDFLSVGSNDLTQYLLAVDRNNARVANLYDALHPAVLAALMHVVKGAHSENKKVSICGELAGDPMGVILLLAMGFDTLSMSPTSLLRVKWTIRNFTITQARELLKEALEQENPQEIRNQLQKAMSENGLANLVRGKNKN